MINPCSEIGLGAHYIVLQRLADERVFTMRKWVHIPCAVLPCVVTFTVDVAPTGCDKLR